MCYPYGLEETENHLNVFIKCQFLCFAMFSVCDPNTESLNAESSIYTLFFFLKGKATCFSIWIPVNFVLMVK